MGKLMKHHRISVTIPNEIYHALSKIISKEKRKMSHLVAEAIAEKLQRMEEEIYAQKINAAFKDPEIAQEQQLMAKLIADNTDVEEMPW
jgi:metal-responsive CopG/Arc/MetJ family transcriptional regulator